MRKGEQIKSERISLRSLFSFTCKKLFPEIKKLFGCDLQDFAEFEYHIKRNADISKFNDTDVASVNIGQFGQFHLGQAFFLSVINDVQPELFVELFVFRFHILTSLYFR